MRPNHPLAKAELQDQLKRDMARAVTQAKYVFFVSGHLLVHPPLSAKLDRYTTPFEVVVTLDHKVISDADLEKLRTKVENEARKQLAQVANNHLMAECTIRNLSLLHTLTENPNGR